MNFKNFYYFTISTPTFCRVTLFKNLNTSKKEAVSLKNKLYFNIFEVRLFYRKLHFA